MTFAVPPAALQCIHRRALPLQLASETNALRRPRALNSCGTLIVDPKTIVAAPAAAELAEVDSERTPIPIASQVTRGAWTREIEELCRALEAQQRAHFPRIDAEEK